MFPRTRAGCFPGASGLVAWASRTFPFVVMISHVATSCPATQPGGKLHRSRPNGNRWALRPLIPDRARPAPQGVGRALSLRRWTQQETLQARVVPVLEVAVVSAVSRRSQPASHNQPASAAEPSPGSWSLHALGSCGVQRGDLVNSPTACHQVCA